ncbi:MAG TPA: mechanosensitive ion channel [Woeseiaceae bacterium]|nr:mechanosensitive ion channel [Woeseiaceae bacterium]
MLEDLSTVWNAKPFGTSITVGQIVLTSLLIFIGYLVSRLSVYLLNRRLATTRLRPDAVQAISRVVYWLILILVFLTALSLLHIPLTAFAFITGAVAIGIGFGAQNIINNFISGWILMTEKPIRIDDFIEIDNMRGVVERIGNRSTRIKRTDGVHLLVPNSSLLEKNVTNWTLVDNRIRTTVRVGVAYGSPVREVARLIEQAVTEQNNCNDSPAPYVVFDDFGDSALIFDAYFWCEVEGERELRAARSNIRFRITELFEERGIVIAFPQRDIHLATSSPLAVRVLGSHEDAE